MIAVRLWTLDSTLELAVHQIDNYRLTSLEKVFPRFLTRLNVIVPVVLNHSHERLLLDPIKVFVEAIEQDIEELLGILLL